MLSGELDSNQTISGFDEVAELLDQLAPGKGRCWDGSLDAFELTNEVAEHVGLGDSVRCLIVGETNNGVAFILRSRNLFNIHRHGFYIKRNTLNDGTDGYELLEAPAKMPKRNDFYLGIDLLNNEKLRSVPNDVAIGFMESLQNVTSR